MTTDLNGQPMRTTGSDGNTSSPISTLQVSPAYQPALNSLRRCYRSLLALAARDAGRSVSDSQIDSTFVAHGLAAGYETLLADFPRASLWRRLLTFFSFSAH